ncbi:MAG TPA: DUF4129 domain-containing protein [Chloroflexota bacterium]|nr:DUF4129 domain-containing protein [Chloroflexota bacterium]
MNTRTVQLRTLWALVAMEAGLALPIISLPTQGDRLQGLLGPLLILALLPAGFFAARHIADLRDPSWRLLGGIAAAILARALVSIPPDAGVAGVLTWLGHNVVAAAIGVGLWWRGGALSASELTPAEIRTEFSLLAGAMLGVLALVRPFVLADQLLLGLAVSLFAVGGLVTTTFARQDAAQASARWLATATVALPITIAVVLVSVLQPELLGAIGNTLLRVIGFVLSPIGLLLSWLLSLLPHGAPDAPPQLLRPPLPDFAPNPAALAELQERNAWIGTVIVVALLLLAGAAALLVVRLMLSNWLQPTVAPEIDAPPTSQADRAGTASGDARALWAWLGQLLRLRFSKRRPITHRATRGAPADAEAADAWTAYRRLLEWAREQGLTRRAAETTGQLRTRLKAHAPAVASAVDLLTTTYEDERYGNIAPHTDRLKRLDAAVEALPTAPAPIESPSLW